MDQTRLSPFEFDVFKQLQESLRVCGASKPFERVLVGVSGGVDSMSLLRLLNAMKSRLEFQIIVGHVHHGDTDDKDLQKFRDQTQEFVSQFCIENDIKFVTNLSDDLSRSVQKVVAAKTLSQDESGLREIRKTWFEKWSEYFDCQRIMTAHHFEDLAETRMIRLIRGTGANGLRAMSLGDEKYLRPLLKTSRQELEKYLSEKGQVHVEDPSNQDRKILRNWMRRDWLPELEKYRKGGVRRLAESLDLIAESVDKSKQESEKFEYILFLDPESNLLRFPRCVLSELSGQRISELLIQVFTRLNSSFYSEKKIAEIKKRLNTEQKDLSFSVGGVDWLLSRDWVSAQPIKIS